MTFLAKIQLYFCICTIYARSTIDSIFSRHSVYINIQYFIHSWVDTLLWGLATATSLFHISKIFCLLPSSFHILISHPLQMSSIHCLLVFLVLLLFMHFIFRFLICAVLISTTTFFWQTTEGLSVAAIVRVSFSVTVSIRETLKCCMFLWREKLAEIHILMQLIDPYR